ncbi:ArnT family glycosyltransferase [Mycolicibacterium komossense]|nr:glycosyltransferase family 39 protein [Mycolicibacterium komossense]
MNPPRATEASDDDHPRGAAAPASRWDRIGLAVLLIATATLYLWNITVNGMGNQFYAGAAWAGSKNWEALLFGSLDPANFITVDKPPVSQWVMGLSGQLFGFSSASMLIPQALMAVASVALLYAAVARISGRNAALLAGAALALTPVAALMFRFNNPDAAMVLLMMLAAYCTVRALQRGSATWMALAGAALGFAFLAKMLEGLMVMPAIGLAYLVAAPVPVRRRLLHLLGALVTFLVSSGWFVVLTLLWPASSRPYIAGSTDNNFMNLVLGYNGFARVLGRNHMGPGSWSQGQIGAMVVDQEQYNPGGGHGFAGFGSQSEGVTRLFSGEFAFEIGWLVPAALLALVLVLISRGRAPRTDMVRAGAILFGGWLLVDGVVLSYMHGMIHPYYSLSLAPAVAGMFAIGVREMWECRESRYGRAGLVALVLTTGVWGWLTLNHNSEWMPALRWTILLVTVVAALALLPVSTLRNRRRVTLGAVAFGLVAALAGPAAYAVVTIGQPHQGGGPTVGPAEADHSPGGWGQSPDNPQLDSLLRGTHSTWSAATAGSSAAAALELSTETSVMAVGGFTGQDPVPTLDEFKQDVAQHRVSYFVVRKGGRGAGPGGRGHSDITDWVTATFSPIDTDGATAYDLSKPK